VAEFCKNKKTIAFDGNHCSFMQYQNMKQTMPSLQFVTVDLEDLRIIKTEKELEYLRIAAKIADDAFTKVLSNLHEGLTEQQVASDLEYRMRILGSEKVSFDTIVVSGIRSSLCHGVPSSKKINQGDFVTFDFGAVYHGYHSDMTRTIVVGKAAEWQRKIYNGVYEAQKIGVQKAKIGMLCADLYCIVKEYLDERGLGQYFTELANKLRPFIDIREMQRLGQLIEYSFLETDWSTTRFDTFVDKVGAKRVLDASESNVRVMTIHASKGLEFDAVILPELAEPIFGHASTVLSRHQNVAESAVSMARYFSKKYTVLDENLKKMHQEDAMVKLQDALSVLYVAMTRAKSELYMLIPHDEKQGKKLTYANILKNTLVPVEKQELNGDFKNISELYSCGMPIKSMCISSKTEENNHLSDNYLFLKKDTVQARKYPKLEVVRPSDLEGEGVVSLNNIFNQHALHLGSLLHSLMENVMWLEDGLPDKNSWRKSLTADFSESEIEEAWSLFIQAIEHPEINVHLRRAFYQHDPQVWCEQRFSMLDNQHKILLGTFDRLVKWSGTKAEVIDFKTDFIKDNSSLNAKVEYYRQQLLAYRYAAAKFLALNEEDVSLTLMFIRTGDVVNVSDN